MIRRLQGHEATDAIRATPHLEPFDAAADQETADEFRELLERARGRVSSASDEVSALSLALAQTQLAAQMRPQPPLERRETPAVSEEEPSGADTPEVSHEPRSAKSSEGSYVAEKDASSTDEQLAPAIAEHDDEGHSAEAPVEAPETKEIADFAEATFGAAVETTQDEGEPTGEETALEDEVLHQSVVSQPRSDSISPKHAFEPTKEAPRVEGSTEKVAKEVAPVSPQAAPEQPGNDTELMGQMKSGQGQPEPSEQVQPLQWKPSVETRPMDTAVSLPKDTAAHGNGDLSIQMAILRQAFENVKGFGGSQQDGAPKQGFSASQAVGAASEARSARGDLQGKASKPMTRPQVQRMLERVETAMKEAARTRDGKTIRFRVEPFNLGEVKVDVSLREGGLHARLKAENQNVAMVLRERAHELQGALRKLGLDVDNVTVTVSEDEDAQYAAGQQNLSDGKSFQEERNNMPSQVVQVVENTVGNELADVTRAGASKVTNAILDHWVA